MDNSRSYSALLHELKNQVLPIRQLCDAVLETEDLSEDVEQKMRLIQRCAEKASAQLKDLDVFPPPEFSSLSLDPVNMTELTRDVVEHVRTHDGKEGWRLRCMQLDDDAVVRGEETWIRNAVRALVKNALRYSKGGGIALRTTRSEENVRVSVSVPPGVPEGKTRAHDPSQSTFGTLNGDNGSLDFGLCFVKEVASRHNGDVELQNKDGQARTYTLLLPAAPQSTDHEKQKESVP